MSQNIPQEYVLFFSEYCDYCKDLLGEIRKFQLEGIFNFFNVDTQRSQLPNFVSEVPCVFLPEFNHVLTGEEVFGLLNHMKKELGLIPEEKPKPQQINNRPGMQPHPSEMAQMNPALNEPPPRMMPQNTGPQQKPQQQQPPQQQQNNEPGELEGYNVCEMGMCSDSYSYLDDNTMIQHNFEMISDGDKVAKNTISSGNDQVQHNSDPRKGSMREQKISDQKYQEFLRQRNESGPTPIERH